MRSYLALLGAGFRRQITYRLALAAGLVTAAFFGVVRTAVFFALYREQDQVAGLDVADAVTYVWVLQGLFAVVWAPWFWEQAEAIRSGEFVVELLRPGDLYLRLAAFDLGRTLSVLVTRTAPTLAVAALVLPRAEGRCVEFARDEVSAAELIARLLAGHEAADRPAPGGAGHRGHRPAHLPGRAAALSGGTCRLGRPAGVTWWRRTGSGRRRRPPPPRGR